MSTKADILIIEDNAEDLELLLLELRNSDLEFNYRHTLDEDSFRSAMTEFMPDIIISDHNLPSFTSIDAMEIARQMDADIPFIVLSGYIGEEEAVDLIVNKGANDFILKSNLKKVPYALRRELENKNLRAQIIEKNRELEKLSVVAKQAINGVLMATPDGITEWVNTAFTKISGYEKEEIIGKKPGRVLQGPNTDKNTTRFIAQKLKEQVPFSVEILNYHKSGEPYWNKLDITPIFNESGKLIRFIGIQEDITEKKRAKDLLLSINDIATSLLTAESLDDIARTVTEKLISNFGLHDCVIYKVNPDRKSLTQVAAYGDKSTPNHRVIAPLTLNFGEGIVGHVAETGKAEIVENTTHDERYIIDDQHRLSELAVPILVDEEVIGVLDTEHPEPDYYNLEDLDHLQLVANMIATKFKAALDRLEKERAQQELKSSEQLLENVADNLPGMIQQYVLYPDGTDGLLYLSDGVKGIHELSPEYALENFHELWDQMWEDDRQSVLKDVEESARNLTKWDSTWRITTPSGKNKWLHGTGNPTAREDGSIVWDTIIIDITGEKEYEQQILYHEQQLRNITDSVDGVILRYLFYPDGSDSITYISEGIRKLFGLEPEAIVNDTSVLWEKILPKHIPHLQASITDSAKNLSMWIDSYEIDINGQKKWVHGIGTPELLEDGVVAWNTLLRDITESKEIERKLYSSNERLDAAITGADLGVWDANLEKGTNFVNDKWFEMLGYTNSEDLHTIEFFENILHPDDAHLVSGQIERIEQGGENNVDVVLRLKGKDGKYRHILDRGRAVEFDKKGKVVRMIGTHLDISSQVSLQNELKESLKEKEFLLGEIHHRVKNNLAIVSGLLELQGMESGDETLKRIIEETARRIKSIGGVHELLYNSDNFTDISIKKYVEKLAENIGTTLIGENLNIQWDLNIDQNIQLNINQAVPIGLLLNELITNSLKYAFHDAHKDPRITIKIDWERDMYHVFYGDNGKGFDPDMIQNPKSLGFTLIKTTLQQLHANPHFITKDQFSVSFNFPPNRIGSHSRLT